MKPLTISDNENLIVALQNEIRRNDASRCDHRLHGVLLVAHGMTCHRVAQLLGDSDLTAVNWVRRFETEGLTGFAEDQRPERPSRLNDRQMAKVEVALRESPERFGLARQMWDGLTVSEFLDRDFEGKVESAPVPANVPPVELSPCLPWIGSPARHEHHRIFQPGSVADAGRKLVGSRPE